MILNAKSIFLEEQKWYYLTHSWADKGVHTFLKGICPKVNVIAQTEFELAYYDSAVQCFNHYITGTLPGVNERVLYIPQTPSLEPNHQMKFNVIPKILVECEVLLLRRDAVSVFYIHSQIFYKWYQVFLMNNHWHAAE